MVIQRIVPAVLLVSAVAVALAGCAVSPPGPVRSEERAIDADVHAIELASSGDLEVVVGDEPSLTITAPASVLPRLTSDSHDGTLTLGSVGGPLLMGWGTIHYKLTVPLIDAIDLAGSGDVSADFAGADDVVIRIAGSGNVDAASVAAQRVRVEISGAGNATIEGTAEVAKLAIAGSGDLDAAKLHVGTASAEVSGSGDMSLDARDTLSAEISGSGEIRYSGTPRLISDVSGSGTISSS